MHLNLASEALSDHVRSAGRVFRDEHPRVTAALALWRFGVYSLALASVALVAAWATLAALFDRLPATVGVLVGVVAFTLASPLSWLSRREWHSLCRYREAARARRAQAAEA